MPVSHCIRHSTSYNTSSLVVNFNNTTNNITNVAHVCARPRLFGKANIDHMVCLTFEEVRDVLDLRGNCSLTPFLNPFELLHLNMEAPRNQNTFLHIVEGEPAAFAVNQRHWREVDCDEMVIECVNNAAIRFLDVKSILAPRMPAKDFSKLARMRDTLERETSGLVKEPSMEVQGLMRLTSNAIAAFTMAHPDLLAHARADAQSAPSFVRPLRTRDLPEWESEVGQMAGPGQDAADRQVSHATKCVNTSLQQPAILLPETSLTSVFCG